MKREAQDFLTKSLACLRDAKVMLGAELFDHAARTAYLACFHLAQAIIFERSGKITKTHNGVHAEFFRQTKAGEGQERELRQFLSKSYRHKATADYAVGVDANISSEVARADVALAERFIEHFGCMLR